jgi:hypothetical protein
MAFFMFPCLPREAFFGGLDVFGRLNGLLKKKINYKKLIQIEHCNTAKNVLKKLDHRWTSINSSYYPFGLPSIHLNLFLNSIYKKYDC